MMRRLMAAVAMLLFGSAPAQAHRLDEYLQATLISVSRDGVHVQLRLAPGVAVFSRVMARIDTNGDGVLTDDEQHAYAGAVLHDLSLSVDGRTMSLRLASLNFASVADMKEGRGEIIIAYDASVNSAKGARRLTFENRHLASLSVYLVNALVPADTSLVISGQQRTADQAVFQLVYADGRVAASAPLSARIWTGMPRLIRLGMRHIAEGTDHLLFLIVLLLPSPLVALPRRWGGYVGARQAGGRILRIVTAFTVGHSITLAAAATGLVRLPQAPVELLIATSILVSAMHAVRPIFPGRESLVAGGFGLVHGLAFATMIAGLGADAWQTARIILGFNIGIEIMQLAVVVAVMPWLLAMARSSVYASVRVTSATVAAVAALGWIGQRGLGAPNPVGPWVALAATHGIAIVGSLAVVAIAVRAPDTVRAIRIAGVRFERRRATAGAPQV